ncbi:MAG: hypothetical protein HY665_03995 [Chloroflexi bacterium]|nr:hypothetical protein [Chloroflexota bacterium]
MGTIETGSKVAIVGGGPAGCFFALYLLKYARGRGIRPEITVYEPRDFHEPGPKGCKGCAGILSASLLRNLSELDLILPEEIIQRRIECYTVHSPYASITLSKPDVDMQIVSVYRGGGARVSHGMSPTGFDGWLLGQAVTQGVRVEAERVASIYLGQEADLEVAGSKLRYDLIMLASGVNASPLKVTGLEYVPPETRIMAQDELHADAGDIESRLGSTAHSFLIPHSGLIFGTMVPKGLCSRGYIAFWDGWRKVRPLVLTDHLTKP